MVQLKDAEGSKRFACFNIFQYLRISEESDKLAMNLFSTRVLSRLFDSFFGVEFFVLRECFDTFGLTTGPSLCGNRCPDFFCVHGLLCHTLRSVPEVD